MTYNQRSKKVIVIIKQFWLSAGLRPSRQTESEWIINHTYFLKPQKSLQCVSQ